METAGKRGGFFISFEGPEGGGKSTQIHGLAAALAEQGHAVWTTREPGGTRAGEMIRPLLLGPKAGALSAWAEALFFSAARAQLVDEVIRPRLHRGELVLCDRYSDSTLAYQGYGRGIDLQSLRRLQSGAPGGVSPPPPPPPPLPSRPAWPAFPAAPRTGWIARRSPSINGCTPGTGRWRPPTRTAGGRSM